MSFSNNQEDAILDDRISTWSTAIYVALFVGDPGEDGSGGAEVSGGSYARPQADAATHWTTAASGGSVSNDAAVVFASPTGSWGTVTHFALYSAASGGTFYGSGALTVPITIASGAGAPTIAIGALTITQD